ncbi:MAG TPA: 2-C-methyl-D-erythritol 4-phosphate cytidylyltransferase, partial [Ferruginibacter sp.]|nr:2-C-methyl-D-erythritol 4-phosphate cytidylyltransferase [Ferruginibacter sp.]
VPKQFLLLQDKPVLYYSIRAFLDAFDTVQLILVLPEAHRATGEQIIHQYFPDHSIEIVNGGETRFHSVYNGLQAIPGNGIVLVHDAVRCLISTDLLQRCVQAVQDHGSAVPVIPVKDSLRQINGAHHQAVDRNQFRLVQTPQCFAVDKMKQAFEQPYREGFTDEASVLEAGGESVHLIEGEERNIKLTTPADLALASFFLQNG